MASGQAKAALFDALASVAQALGSGRRAEIVDVLAQGERSVEELAGEISQSVANTSQHLQVLARAGLVRSRRDGTRVIYRLASDRVAELWAAVRDVAVRHVAEVSVLDRLAYLGTRIYFTGAAAWNAASAINNVATHPTSWRAWAVGGAVTAASVMPYTKRIAALKLGGTTPALASASSEDPVLSQIMVRIGDKRSVVAGGFSGTGYADVDAAVQAWTADLQREIETHGAENLIVVSGATSDGIGDIAYSVAKAHGVDTLGIVSEEARQFGVSPYVDDVVFVPDPGKTWSTIAPDGQSYMVSAAAIYYGYGGGEIARDELIEAQQRGIPTVIYEDFGPDPASKQLLAKLAKNPSFDPTPVKAAIGDGRLRAQQLP